jgi:hypothetical protein
MRITKVTIKPGYVLRELGGEFVIAHCDDTNNGAVDGLPSLNETCIFLWEKLSLGATTLELIDLLARKKQLDYEDAEQDVGEFLAKLINGHIVDY